MKLTRQQIDDLLERFDQTEPGLQREVISKFVSDRLILMIALQELVQLQSHYAKLLNQYDGGLRTAFGSAQQWLDRLGELGKIPADHGIRCERGQVTIDLHWIDGCHQCERITPIPTKVEVVEGEFFITEPKTPDCLGCGRPCDHGPSLFWVWECPHAACGWQMVPAKAGRNAEHWLYPYLVTFQRCHRQSMPVPEEHYALFCKASARLS